KARELKTLPKVIKDGIRQYGFEHIKLVSEYVKAQKVSNIRSYMMQALSKGWAEDYIVQKKISTSQKAKNETLDLREFEVQPIESVDLFQNHLEVQEFLSTASVEIKLKIEQDAYKDYIKMCGIEGKIQKMAFSAAKEKIIKDYLSKNLANYTAQTAINLEMDNVNSNKFEDIQVLEFVSPSKEKIENSKTAEKILKIEDSKIESEIVKAQKVNNPKVIFQEMHTAQTGRIQEIKKVYRNMSMFQLDILDILEGENIKEVNKIIRLLSITKFFEGELGDLHITLEYNEDEESIIKITSIK
ncbi:MAG: hypothetical protein ACRCTC_01650, partial [Cetobacterium sp.]